MERRTLIKGLSALPAAGVFVGCARGRQSTRPVAPSGDATGSRATWPRRRSVRVGDRAPDFTLPSQSGGLVSLRSFEGKTAVVLYFYPKDETPICTAEACSFRDSYTVFLAAGAEVIGVSADTTDSHKEFASRHKLPFTLLSDESGKTRKLYGIRSTAGLIAGRVTYVIDKKGIVRMVFSSQFNPSRHVTEALKVLKTIQDEKRLPAR